jgi:Sec-independent protein translocase protein TatA
MRMGMFLLGGIVGAAAVVYINRNNMMMSNFSNAGQSVGKMMDNAKTKFSSMNMGMNRDSEKSNQNSTQSNEKTNLSKVEEIVNKDANLKSQVDEILENNNQSSTNFRMQ